MSPRADDRADVRLEKSVSRFLSPRKRLDPRGTDRSRRPPAQSADGSRHSSARAATAAHTERSRLFGEREARPHTLTDAWGLRIDRRAHASRRLPRAATMVRARSSPRHRLFRHIATARPTGSSEPTPSRIAPRDASSARIGFDRVGHRESASATRAPRPPPRPRLDPHRLTSHVSFPSSRVSRPIDAGRRQTRRGDRADQREAPGPAFLSAGRRHHRMGPVPGRRRVLHRLQSRLGRCADRTRDARTPPFFARLRNTKKRTPNPIRESRTFLPL